MVELSEDKIGQGEEGISDRESIEWDKFVLAAGLLDVSRLSKPPYFMC